MTDTKRKIMDIAAPSSYFKKVSVNRPKVVISMADIIRPAAENKSAKNFSLFFFSLDQFLIPRLLPKFLALFLTTLLVAAPIWPVLAEEFPTSILPLSEGEEERRRGEMDSDSEAGIMKNPSPPPFDFDKERSEENPSQPPFDKGRNEETPISVLPLVEEEEGGGILPPLEKKGEDGFDEGRSNEKSLPASLFQREEQENFPPLKKEGEGGFDEGRSEEKIPPILPLEKGGENNEEPLEKGRENDEESLEKGGENNEESLGKGERNETPPLEKGERNEIPSLEKEDEGGFDEGKEEEENEESEEFREDIYEQIRRDLDSEWKSRVEEYKRQLAIKEEELRNRGNLWEESLSRAVKHELEKELKQKCVKLSEDGYYCLSSETGDEKTTGGRTPDLNENFPSRKEIFSLKNTEKGNREIFLKENGALRQVTDNNFDDIFPALDIAGNLAVWQSLVDGFWQIFIYDSAGNQLKQLTNSEFNNMNPQIQQSRIVWQAWRDNNWEIIFAEKKTDGCLAENDCWQIRRLTKNNYHDMFPKIAGDLITWQVYENNVWQVTVYNLKTGSLSRLAQKGEKTENPRFVVLWESRQAGLKKYFTYDLSSGELLELKTGSEDNSGQEELPSLPLTENVIAVPATFLPGRPDEATSSPEEKIE